MQDSDPQKELCNLFTGLVEHAFITEAGVCAPALTDYLAGLLVEFLHVDRIYRVHTVDGQVIRDLARLQASDNLSNPSGVRTRERVVNRYIGDFTLFWAGLYPEMLQARRQGGVNRLREYLLEGKRGYSLASELSKVGDVPTGELLGELSANFEFCVQGLHTVRTSWEQLLRGPSHN